MSTKKAVSVSSRQRECLKELKRFGGGNWSCTNPTMNALEKRGLVRLEWENIPSSIYRKEKWVITQAGCDYLAPQVKP